MLDAQHDVAAGVGLRLRVGRARDATADGLSDEADHIDGDADLGQSLGPTCGQRGGQVEGTHEMRLIVGLRRTRMMKMP